MNFSRKEKYDFICMLQKSVVWGCEDSGLIFPQILIFPEEFQASNHMALENAFRVSILKNLDKKLTHAHVSD